MYARARMHSRHMQQEFTFLFIQLKFQKMKTVVSFFALVTFQTTLQLLLHFEQLSTRQKIFSLEVENVLFVVERLKLRKNI